MGLTSDIEQADLFTAHLEAIVKAKAFGHVLHLRGIGNDYDCDTFSNACDTFAGELIDRMFPGDSDECLKLRMETIKAYHLMDIALNEMMFGKDM